MMRILLATRSEPKAREIRGILADVPGLELLLPHEVGLDPDPAEEAIEAFDTFEENAAAKARWFLARSGLPALADDSGLEVDALGGAPGVWSRRFAPPEWIHDSGGDQDRANNRFLLHRLEGTAPEARGARFTCVAALALPGEDVRNFRGAVEGRILEAPVGEDGFGYDPLFRESTTGTAFGLASPEEKAVLSHRGRAFRQLRDALLTETDAP